MKTLLRTASAVVAAFAAANSFANTWTNTLGGVFSDPGNWKEGAAPSIDNDANFSKAPGSYTVSFSGDAESAAATFDGDQEVILNVGRGNTWTIKNDKNITIGDMPDVDTSLHVVSGCVTGAYKILTANRVVKAVKLTVENPGTVLMSNRDDLNIGWNGPNTSVEVKDGAVLRGGRGVYIGYNAAASNNTVLVSGEGSVFGNGPVTGSNVGITIGSNAGYNTVRIENGAMMTNTVSNITLGDSASAPENHLTFANGSSVRGASQIYVGNNASDNSAVFTGGSRGEFPNGMTIVGVSGHGNTLEVLDGSFLLPGTHLYLGQNKSAMSNTVHIAGAGTVVTNKAYDFNCGNGGSYNTWIVEDGAYVCPRRSMITGTASGSSYNTTIYRGEGTYLKTIEENFACGQTGTNNLAVITDGARADIKAMIGVGTGAGACSNMILVANGAVVTNSNITVGGNATASHNALVVSNATLYAQSAVNIGNNGAHNRLEVLDGASLCTGHHFYFGGPVGSSNTYVRLSGEGSYMKNNYDVDVGNNARDCRMDIEDGATFFGNRHAYIGHQSTASNNVLRISNATFTLTKDNGATMSVNYDSKLLFEGSNNVVNIKYLNFAGESTLAFNIGRDGFQTPITVQRPNYESGTKLVIDANEFAKAGGGWIDLMTYNQKIGTATEAMTLIPDGILVEETGTSLRIKVPNYAGTVLFLK